MGLKFAYFVQDCQRKHYSNCKGGNIFSEGVNKYELYRY